MSINSPNKDRAADTRVAVVIGGAGGIGKAIAAQLAADGFALVIADLRADAAEIAAREIAQQHGVKASAIKVDITQPAECDAVIAHAVQQFGGVDVLINSAGISRPQPTLEIKPDEWHRMIDVQLNGVFFCAQAAGKQMVQQGKERGGVIINITSINAEAAFPMRTGYAVAKAGVAMLTKTLAIEWAQHNIRVNAVGPSHTETEMTLQNIQKGVISVDAIQKRIPLGRLAKPQDVANAVSFLCSDKANYITGHSLYVDGGYLAYGYL